MAVRRTPYGIQSDWAEKAQRWQLGLGPSNPFVASANEGSTPREWVEVHPERELGVVLSGRAQRSYLNHEFSVGPGEVWLSERWEPHGVRMEEPVSRVVIVFTPGFLGSEEIGGIPWQRLFSTPPEARPRVRDQAMRAKVLALGQALRTEVLAKSVGWEDATRYYVLLLLLLLRRGWRPPNLPEAAGQRQSDLLRVMPALEVVETAPSRRISVQEAAEACGLGVSQFSRVFRAAMRTSFGKFEQNARLGVAARLLRETDLPTQSIAERAGFVDAGHLYRIFMKATGRSPTDYRRAREEDIA
jgi:AraC-like DNA-binding protein